MLLSWNWLGRHVDLDGLDPVEVARSITLHVAELEGVLPVGKGLEGLRAVRVESVAPHPGSENLTLVTVADRDRHQTVVCGAPNARQAVGRTVVLAPLGATLPDGTEIRPAEIRGVVSEGMLLSEAEMGVSEDHAGIVLLAPGTSHGVPLVEAVPIQDTVFEIDNKAITHRPDLWGHRGFAREIALLFDRPMLPLDPQVDFGRQRTVDVRVADPALCPRYLCAHFTGVRVAPSPEWLRCLLRAVGVRPISNVVDLTNFVMLDLGNPLHAFDARYVAGPSLVIRRATAGETIRTLDGQDRVCTDETLLICDASRPVALAGIMGGEDSEIRDDTTDVILEAANFQARNIRRTSMRLGLRSESSARFEKALDPEMAGLAARCFSRLLLDTCPDAVSVGPLVDVRGEPARKVSIQLSPKAVSARLGIDVPAGRVRHVLGRLGFTVYDQSSGAFRVDVPSWRATKDVAIAEDLIEEVGRIHGYENIPPVSPPIRIDRPRLSPAKHQERRARSFLSATCGMHETLSYAFTLRPMLEKLGADTSGRLRLKNPISAELDLLRRSMIPNLLDFAERNARWFDAFGLYEIGRVFEPQEDGLPEQHRYAAAVIVGGDADAEHRFRAIRGMAEGLLAAIRAPEPTWRRAAAPGFRATWVHPMRSVDILAGDTPIGVCGLLHPEAATVLDVTAPISFLELDLDATLAAGVRPDRYEPLPRYPSVRFDVSFDVDEAVTAESIRAAITAGAASDLLRSCELFANYHLGGGRKSVSFHLEFRASDRSLKDKDVKKVVDRLVARVSETLGGALRGG